MTHKTDDASAWLAADRAIKRWLSGKGSPRRLGANLVGPPRRGELGDTEREEMEGAALTTWAEAWRDGVEAEPTTLAARALGDFRKKARKRRELIGSQVDLDDCAIEDPRSTPEEQLLAAEEYQATKPVQVADHHAVRAAPVSLRLTSVRQVSPDETRPSALRSLLSEAAQAWQSAANLRPDEPRLRAVAAILWSVLDDRFPVDKIAGPARHFLAKHNVGPRTRPQEAETFIRAVATRDADRVLRSLLILPLIAADLRALPRDTSNGWPRELLRVVSGALERAEAEPPDQVARHVLSALGAPHASVKNLVAHRAMRARRANAGPRVSRTAISRR
jgi:hypothetical protein